MSRLTPRPQPKRRGRPSALTPERADQIVALVADGNYITTACALVGIAPSTLYRWRERAEAVACAIEGGERCDAEDLGYLEFRERLDHARACAESLAVDVIQQAMQGGMITSEEPVRDVHGNVQRDRDGQTLYTRKFTKPDGRLALEYLVRFSPEKWGRNASNPYPELWGSPDPMTTHEDSEYRLGLANLVERFELFKARQREIQESNGHSESSEAEGGAGSALVTDVV